MSTRPFTRPALSAALALCCSSGPVLAQAQSSRLPALAPTAASQAGALTAPIAATSAPADRSGQAAGRPEVQCTDGQLEVHAQNSSLNGILRAIARCTGMRITGGIPEQRVYGNYGPAAPATVLATLIDGTGSNMLLHETASDQPAELILTPRVGGPTPPSPSTYNDADDDTPQPAPPQSYPPMQRAPYTHPGQAFAPRAGQMNGPGVPQGAAGSAVTGPQPIPQPNNNVNGNPANTSPTASTYPTTNSVPLDAIRTPSTTPSSDGIVDAPNPPAAGSDTAAGMSSSPTGSPGAANINPNATSPTSIPGATNTTVPANTTQGTPGQAPDLTPEQIFEQLRQRQQQQQQQQPPNPQ